MKRGRWSVLVLLLAVTCCACPNRPQPSDGDGDDGSSWTGPANVYSWDGSWRPSPEELPPPGLFDDQYGDAHLVRGQPSPLLPPGHWDWDGCPGDTCALGAWNYFSGHLGSFAQLVDADGKPFGWQFAPNDPVACDLNVYTAAFEGSSGTDVIDCGPEGEIEYNDLTLGDGPDMLRFRGARAGDIRTGSSESGHLHDNDLVIGGSDAPLPAGQAEIYGWMVHTGPGRDLVFVNNMVRAGVDLGNGAGGRTDTLDPDDGDDVLVLGGYWNDSRIFGGNGNDLFIWHINEIAADNVWKNGAFFGGGGWNPAVWDAGIDRLVLDIPADTPVRGGGQEAPGVVVVKVLQNYSDQPVPDVYIQDNVYGRYYEYAGTNPDGKKTLVLVYRSPSDLLRVVAALTAIEELQIGIGSGAIVYRLDETNGHANPDPALQPVTDVPSRAHYIDLITHFGR